MSYIAIDPTSFRYLSHYGIKGQKWGIRRFQNPDGTLTSEGRKRAKTEYKEDNKRAFEFGKDATIIDRAYDKSLKAKNKATLKYDAKPTDKNKKRKDIADLTEKKLKSEKQILDKKVQEHYDFLVRKYGKEAVSDIRYDKQGRINEKVQTGKDYVEAGLMTMSFAAVTASLGLPMTPIYYPATAQQLGNGAYRIAKYRAKKEYNQGR